MNIQTLPDAPPMQAYTKVFAYDANKNLIYEGWAKSGLDPASNLDKPYFAIKKYTYDGSGNLTTIQWAGGNTNESNVWDNRTSLTYK